MSAVSSGGSGRGARFQSPIWRVLGSGASWLLFTFCFSLLYMGSALVMGLGGYCASGGAYVIETECPDAVVATMPLSIFGGLAAVALGVFLTRGFGMPVVSWAWPVLFVGLGAGFLIASAQPGGITFLIVGVLFVVMGAAPLVLELRASVRALFLGTTNVAGVKFAAERAGPAVVPPVQPLGHPGIRRGGHADRRRLDPGARYRGRRDRTRDLLREPVVRVVRQLGGASAASRRAPPKAQPSRSVRTTIASRAGPTPIAEIREPLIPSRAMT